MERGATAVAASQCPFLSVPYLPSIYTVMPHPVFKGTFPYYMADPNHKTRYPKRVEPQTLNPKPKTLNPKP